METDWAENRANCRRILFVARWAKCLMMFIRPPDAAAPVWEEGTSQIPPRFISAIAGMIELYISEGKTETRWQPRPADPELEAEVSPVDGAARCAEGASSADCC